MFYNLFQSNQASILKCSVTILESACLQILVQKRNNMVLKNQNHTISVQIYDFWKWPRKILFSKPNWSNSFIMPSLFSICNQKKFMPQQHQNHNTFNIKSTFFNQMLLVKDFKENLPSLLVCLQIHSCIG